jgi:hypothetical protein
MGLCAVQTGRHAHASGVFALLLTTENTPMSAMALKLKGSKK